MPNSSGGAVLGGQYDATGTGALIPTTSVDQYGATLANWFGVGAGNLNAIFPNIGNFGPLIWDFSGEHRLPRLLIVTDAELVRGANQREP